MAFIDPHMHIWDPNDGNHTAIKNYGLPAYLPTDYTADFKDRIQMCVFVEAIPDDPVEETRWVAARANVDGAIPIKGIVANMPLHKDNIEEIIKGHLEASPLVKGGRLILFEPGGFDNCNYLADNPGFKNGFGLLEKYSLSWDLQINPAGLKSATTFLKDFPKVPVVLDHVGMLKLSGETPLTEEDKKVIEEWKQDLKGFAALPNTHVKLSMLNYTITHWFEDPQKEELAKSVVLDLINIFGSNRCMFGSNFPVDKVKDKPNGTSTKLYDSFCKWVAGLPQADKDNLFVNTAKNFYRL
eukprot:TRINITY_DN67701_c8_g6_i1.p1 TRINITY_DN67701_c8_g6~~TRINITY_DN67701_c8_g6_i1.p1  ORF type:complete len:298 (-),score=47.64 TRINITY_DN67701_c8_g6_i1:1414-2307(-)